MKRTGLGILIIVSILLVVFMIVAVAVMVLVPIRQAKAECADDRRFSLLLDSGQLKYDDALRGLNVRNGVSFPVVQPPCAPTGTYKLYIL